MATMAIIDTATTAGGRRRISHLHRTHCRRRFQGVFVYLNLISWPPIDFMEPHRPQLFGLYSPISPKDTIARPLYISTADGAKLGAWHLSGRATSGARPVLIYCHGNAESRAYGPSHRRYEAALAEGYDVVTFDYRGFG